MPVPVVDVRFVRVIVDYARVGMEVTVFLVVVFRH
jgi:hypothetical protein